MTKQRGFLYRQGRSLNMLIALIIIAPPAVAQTTNYGLYQPPQNIVDENGVNIVTGGMVAITPKITIGIAENRRLDFYEKYSEYVWTNPFDIALSQQTQGSIVIGVYIVKFDKSIYFSKSGTTFYNKNWDGSTLSLSNSQYVYTERDGTMTYFPILPVLGSTQITANNYNSGYWDALPTKIIEPTGRVTTFNYKQQHLAYVGGSNGAMYWRIQSITNSDGLQLKFSYPLQTMSSSSDMNSWEFISGVMAINNSVDYCTPTADTCASLNHSWPALTISQGVSGINSVFKVVDPANAGSGLATNYILDSSYRLLSIQNPAQPAANENISYNSNNTVASLIKNNNTFNYNFSISGTNLVGSLSGPNGFIRTTTSDMKTGAETSVVDGTSNITSFC